MRQLLAAVAVFALAGSAFGDGKVTPAEVIVQFNGKEVDGVPADSKNKDFRKVFEKDLKAAAEKLPGKPEVKLTDMFTIINGAAIKVSDKAAAEKLKAALEKLPYVKMVEVPTPTPPPVH